MKNSDWQPISTAPLDGTLILVTETPNGENFNVYPAAWMNYGGGDPRLGQDRIGIVGWWAIRPSRYTGEGGTIDLPVKWKALACTPLCWKPFPTMEPMKKIRNRKSQVLRSNEIHHDFRKKGAEAFKTEKVKNLENAKMDGAKTSSAVYHWNLGYELAANGQHVVF